MNRARARDRVRDIAATMQRFAVRKASGEPSVSSEELCVALVDLAEALYLLADVSEDQEAKNG